MFCNTVAFVSAQFSERNFFIADSTRSMSMWSPLYRTVVSPCAAPAPAAAPGATPPAAAMFPSSVLAKTW